MWLAPELGSSRLRRRNKLCFGTYDGQRKDNKQAHWWAAVLQATGRRKSCRQVRSAQRQTHIDCNLFAVAMNDASEVCLPSTLPRHAGYYLAS